MGCCWLCLKDGWIEAGMLRSLALGLLHWRSYVLRGGFLRVVLLCGDFLVFCRKCRAGFWAWMWWLGGWGWGGDVLEVCFVVLCCAVLCWVERKIHSRRLMAIIDGSWYAWCVYSVGEKCIVTFINYWLSIAWNDLPLRFSNSQERLVQILLAGSPVLKMQKMPRLGV